MAEPSPRVPSRRPPPDRTLSRVLGVAGVVGLFVILIVVVSLIGSAGGDDDDAAQDAAATATPTRTAKPTPTPTPKPTVVPLTADEKLDRQDDVDVVRSRGFTVVKRGDWKPDDTLQVLIGKASSGGYLAFFFVDGEYLGNDSSDLSAKLRVHRTDDLVVTLSYGIYQAGDESDAPTGDPISVPFRYDGGAVSPAEAIPAPEQRTPGRFTG